MEDLFGGNVSPCDFSSSCSLYSHSYSDPVAPVAATSTSTTATTTATTTASTTAASTTAAATTSNPTPSLRDTATATAQALPATATAAPTPTPATTRSKMVIATRPSSYEERWSPCRVQECVQLWDLTPREHSQLLAFKTCIQDVDHWKNDPLEVIRFLKEFKFHLKTTEHKFRASIQWRLEHGVDSILEDYTPPALYNYFPLAVLQGADKDGDPIYVERSGAADTLGLLHRFGKDEMIRQAIWGKELMTRGPWQSNRTTTTTTSRRVKHFTTILDLKGLNRHHLNPSLVPVGQAVTRLVQDNYPGFGKKILVIRAPAFFRFVWNVFKHFVDPHVKDLIEIATEKETPQMLQKYMDLAVLPKEILPDVGRGQAEDGYEPIWEGGPLPPPSKDDWQRRTPVFFVGKDGTTKETTTTPNATNTPTTKTKSSSSAAVAAIVTPQSTPTPTPVKTSILMDSSSSQSQSPTSLSQSPPQTPIQPTISVTSMSTMSSSSDANNWEVLPSSPPLPHQHSSTQKQHKRHVPQLQAWTVTPRPLSRNHTQTVWSTDNFQQMAELWQLTHVQQADMQQLRQRLVDVHHWKNDPHEVVRYYLEYHGNLDTAEQAFRDMVAWRIEHDNIDHLLERYQEQPPDPLFYFMPLAMLRGVDRDGDPIYLDRVGACDYASLLAHFGHEALMKYVTFIAELNSSRRFWQQTYEQKVGHRVRNYNLIFDLEGLGWHHYMRPGLVHFLKQISRLLQDNYAGWEKRILFIRAPANFKLIWSLVKHCFDPHIRAKIQVAGHTNYLALLDKYMDRTVLPPEICPKDGMGIVMPGYYENVKLKGGPIPKQALQKAKKKAPGYGSQSVPVFPLTTTTTTKTPAHSIFSRSAPMPPSTSDDDNDDDDEAPSSPVSTTRLMAGYWDDTGKDQVEEVSSSSGGEQKKLFASPMFKYNW